MSLPAPPPTWSPSPPRAPEHGGNHESLSPYLTGGGAFVILMLLLWITTRFNRDR